MLQLDPTRPLGGSRGPARRLVLYVEGPRDRAVLRGWAQRLLPSLGQKLLDASVILGGRRPARAVEHFRGLGGESAGARGLCVLDRDDGADGEPPVDEPGLEFFTWSRRHIESYLLVPAAIQRALRLRGHEGRMARLLREHLPPAADEAAFRELDAKRLLGPNGALPRALGFSLPLGRIARATRESELHPDVHELFARVRAHAGQPEPERVLR